MGEGRWVGELAGAWVQSRRRAGRIVAVTATNHRCILDDFVRRIGDRPVSRLTRRQIAKWEETLGALAPSTRRARVSCLRGFARWLLAEGHVSVDLMETVPVPREPRRQPRGIPGGGTGVARLLAHCPDARARLIVVLMIQLGLRCGEVARLELGDLDLLERAVHVRGKGGHERTLRLTEEAMLAVGDYLTEEPAVAGPLVRSRRDPHSPLTADTISGLVSRWMLGAGVKRAARDGVTGHALRHQAAHDLLCGGASPVDVQHVLGHAHLSTTQVYLPRLTAPLARIMEGRWYGRREAASA